jgi:hypothetical protein
VELIPGNQSLCPLKCLNIPYLAFLLGPFFYNRPNQAFRKAYSSIGVGVADLGCLFREPDFFVADPEADQTTTKRRGKKTQFSYLYLAIFLKLKIIYKKFLNRYRKFLGIFNLKNFTKQVKNMGWIRKLIGRLRSSPMKPFLSEACKAFR